MAPTDFPEPHPPPITEIWPSGANTLLRCGLRAAFERDPTFSSWKRGSTFSVLGDAAHAVSAAAVARQSWGDDETTRRRELTAVWDAEINEGARRLAQAWSPSTPPSPDTWPTYQLVRARTIRRGLREVASRAGRDGGGRIPGTGIELTMVDAGSMLRGRADRIDRVAGEVHIVDLKTGLHQGEPTDDQRRQLLLYAVLYERTNGEWPAALAIENASGEQIALPFDPAEAADTLDEVLEAVASFNTLVTTKGPFTPLANPGAETCRWCPFRTCCEAYWVDLEHTWGHRSLRGDLQEVGSAGVRSFAVVAVRSPEDAPEKVVHIANIAAELDPDAGRFAGVDLSSGPEHKHIEANWWSRVQTW